MREGAGHAEETQVTHTKDTMIAFRDRVEAAFLDRRIRSPVHLPSDGQAEPLLRIFEGVRPQDWVFSGWRSMWHALLKGMPEGDVFQMILDGRSMYLMSREYRFVCSSIVGGILPIALGVAAGMQRSGEDARVYAFSGDMTARSGLFHECIEYAKGHCLPIRFCVEDNGLSTDTPTAEAWGRSRSLPEIEHYKYARNKAHVGVGTHVSF